MSIAPHLPGALRRDRPPGRTPGAGASGRGGAERRQALSRRIGHADVAFTMKQYVQTDLEADREVANKLADLILGGLLTTGEIIDRGDGANPNGSNRHHAEDADHKG